MRFSKHGSGCGDYCRNPRDSAIDLTQSLLIEREHAESFIAEGIVPGVEVHDDRDYVPWIGDEPAGSIEVFLGSACAGIHSLSVLERHQRQGIGSALIEHACKDLRRLGAKSLGLLATTEGQQAYVRRGFREVARFGYWYRSFQR